jgi:hypothetical protein
MNIYTKGTIVLKCIYSMKMTLVALAGVNSVYIHVVVFILV